jgi:hypothetical protein
MSDIVLLASARVRVAPRMPACEHKDDILRPAIIHDVDRRGNSVEAIDHTIRIRPGAVLPIGACYEILDEVDQSSAPSTPPMAAHLVSVLVTFYSEHNVPQKLQSALTSAFAAYPPDIGFQAIEEITQTLERMPSGIEVRRRCHALMEARHYKWRVAQQHLREHERAASDRCTRRRRKLDWSKHCKQFPHLRIYTKWERRFRQRICLWRWLFVLPGWIE